MTSKTIALTGAEIRVDYGGGTNVWLRNDSTAVVYASAEAGISAGADGVISIPAGQAAAVYGAAGTVYLLGTGSVQLVGSDYTACPFKTSAQAGGSGADDVARAAIEAHAGNADIHISAVEKAAWNGKAELSDIPDKLPADGGNADTLNGRHSGRIATKDQNGAYFDDNAENINDAYLQWDGSHYFILKTISGNLTMADNADTLDGKHASDFVDVNDTETQIEIPSDTNNPIDVPNWIKTNGKRYTRYFTYNSTGRTNVPNNSETWVWYYFDGLNIIAREFITDNVWTASIINGSFTGWKLINSSNADTVDGKHADDFTPVTTGVSFNSSAKEYAETYKSGAENIEFTWRGYGAPDAPDSDGDWFFHAYRGDSSWIRIVAFDIRHTASYEIAKAGGSWGEWKKLADGGNAASVGTYTEEKLAALEARIAALEGGNV